MKRFLLIPGFVAAALAYAVWDGESGIRPWLQMREDLASSQLRITEIRREIRALERDAVELENDPFAIESAIREDLKLARSGELVVRFSSGDRSSTRFP